MRGAARLAVVAALIGAGVAVTNAAAATPTPVTGFTTPTVGLSVSDGDILEVGNSSLTCLSPDELVNAACARAMRRQSLLPEFFGSNNDYVMRPAGRTDATTFDQSSATFELPAGTTVRYAQLDWGGNTGSYLGTTTLRCMAQRGFRPLAVKPPAPAAADPRDQQLGISVRTGTGIPTTQTIPLDTVRSGYLSSATRGAAAEMYSDWADVTGDLANVTPAQAVTVDVTNVWGAIGPGCSAGWSLTVVYGSAQPSPNSTLRQIDLYNTHLRVPANSDLSVTLPEPSDDPAAAHVDMGVTAYDGDWNNHSDTLAVDGTAVDDPCGPDPASDNFFSSCANGATDPSAPGVAIPNNLSVDAKTFQPAVSPDTAPGAQPGDIEVELTAGSDQYLLQTVVVAEDIHPSLTETVRIPATTLHEGDTATYTVTGTNNGDIPLTVTLADSTATDCTSRRLGLVAPGQSYSADCHVPRAHTFTDTATVTGQSTHDESGQTLPPLSATFTITVLGPQLSISQSASPSTVVAGRSTTVTFTVRNNGDPGTDGPLTGVTVSDPDLPGCAPAPIPSIDAGSSATTTCDTAPARTVTTTAIAVARDSTQATVSATSEPMTITVDTPALTVTNVAGARQVGPGGQVNFTVTVHNTGDTPLSVQVSNDTAKDCDFVVTDPALPAGAARSQQCTVRVPDSGVLTDVASYTAVPVSTAEASPGSLTGHAQASVAVVAGAPLSAAPGVSNPGTPGPNSAASGSRARPGKEHSAGHGRLAFTGVAIGLPIGVGALLLAGGVTLVVATRRRNAKRS